MANSALTTTVTVPDTLISGRTEDTSPDHSADYVLTYDASAGVHKKVLGTNLRRPTLATEQASTSGTAIDFTGIPAGTRMIVVMIEAASTNGTGELIIQLGDEGGVEATGYNSIVGGITSAAVELAELLTTGFIVQTRRVAATSAPDDNVVATLFLKDASDFTWMIKGNSYNGSIGAKVDYFMGIKALSAALDRIRFTNASGDTFDAGSVNISYF